MNKKLIFLLISALVFAYVTIRAAVLGITYDEVWTLHSFVPLSVYHIFSFEPCDANNQILNTLLIKAFFLTSSRSVFIARLPNVLAFGVYAYFCYKIADGFLSKINGISLFIILLLNPFILDFFGLARGYGLAMTLEMGSVFHLLQYMNSGKLKNYSFSLIFSILATLSNFTFLYFFIGVVCIGNYISLIRNRLKMKYLNTFSTGLFFTVLLAVLIYLPVTKLIMNERLYYGGNTGFYHDTLLSLSSFSLYHPYNLQLAQIVLNVFLISLGLVVFFNFYKMRKLNANEINRKAIISLLLIGITILATLLNHYISGTLYLTDRTALLFFPLLMMVFVFFADSIIYRPFKISAKIVVISFSVLSLVNFSMNVNFVKTILWPFDAHTENILSRINSVGKSENKIKTIDFSWLLESSVNYYVHKNKYSNLAVVKDENDREKLNVKANYYIYYGKSQDKVGYLSDQQIILNIKKDTAWSYADEDIYVFKNLNAL